MLRDCEISFSTLPQIVTEQKYHSIKILMKYPVNEQHLYHTWQHIRYVFSLIITYQTEYGHLIKQILSSCVLKLNISQ